MRLHGRRKDSGLGGMLLQLLLLQETGLLFAVLANVVRGDVRVELTDRGEPDVHASRSSRTWWPGRRSWWLLVGSSSVRWSA